LEVNANVPPCPVGSPLSSAFGAAVGGFYSWFRGVPQNDYNSLGDECDGRRIVGGRSDQSLPSAVLFEGAPTIEIQHPPIDLCDDVASVTIGSVYQSSANANCHDMGVTRTNDIEDSDRSASNSERDRPDSGFSSTNPSWIDKSGPLSTDKAMMDTFSRNNHRNSRAAAAHKHHIGKCKSGTDTGFCSGSSTCA
jgi:hypothetical protein